MGIPYCEAALKTNLKTVGLTPDSRATITQAEHPAWLVSSLAGRGQSQEGMLLTVLH